MILNKLMIRGFRGLFEDATIEISPDVTVLTGANDAGKSTVLDVLRWISGGREFGEDDVNFAHVDRSIVPRREATNIGAQATYTVLEDNDYLRQGAMSGWKVEFVCSLMTGDMIVAKITDADGKAVKAGNRRLVRRPRVIDLAQQEDIGTEISQDNLNESRNKLLELAFNKNYWNTLGDLSVRNQNMRRNEGNSQLKKNLSSVKPKALPIDFELDFVSRDPLVISVGLVDKFGGRAWLPQRGAGYQKLINLMFTLLTVDPKSDNVILIYDEPETSLHADAQHSFRRVLEGIADQPNFQVIYATHSPAMINPRRPTSLRLLTRESEKGVATTKIHNKTYTESNYQSVRAQLGILPIDSLMFASVGIIAEGPTERLALTSLIDRLIKNGDPEKYPNLKLHWRLSFVVSAGGTGEFRRWIEFAKAQNVSVIALLDGDSIKLGSDLKEEYQDIQVVSFDEGTEIEEVVDENIYFEALEAVVPGNQKDMKKKYDAWLSTSQFAKGKMFSKRVEMWLKDELNTGLDKPKVMAKAIKLAQMDEICWTKLNDLVASIGTAVDNL